LVAAELQFPFFPMKKLPSKELDDGFCELGFSQSLKKFGIWNFWCREELELGRFFNFLPPLYL
jgi:hypothetical protein